MVWRLNSLSSSSLMRAHTPIPNSVPFGTPLPRGKTGRDAFHRVPAQMGTRFGTRPYPPQLPHDELQEEQRGLGVCFPQEVALDAFLLSPRRAGW